MAEERAHIGARVRTARERLGWSREELAYRSGVSWSGIAQAESGRRKNLRPATLSALATALRVSVDYLISGAPASTMLDHVFLPYRSDQELVEAATPFLAEGIERSEAVLALTTEKNIDLLRASLGRHAARAEFVESASWLTEPAAALSTIKAFAGAKVEEGAAWIRFLGEPIWEGRSDAEASRWMRFESLLNLVFAAWPMIIVCPYDERTTGLEVRKQARLMHPRAFGDAENVGSSEYTDPADFVL